MKRDEAEHMVEWMAGASPSSHEHRDWVPGLALLALATVVWRLVCDVRELKNAATTSDGDSGRD